jgi:excisionase family DNA binding protein
MLMRAESEMQEMLSTAGAAGLLGVSQASVRRWGDSGLLPMQRVGRRRRFGRDDLTAFLKTSGQAIRDRSTEKVTLGGVAVQVGTHLATFYASDAGRLRIAVPFLRDGLAAGQPCFLVASGALLDGYLEALEKELGDDLAEATRSGRLVTVPAPGATVAGALAFWEDSVPAAASKFGPTTVRIVGDMACEKKAFATIGQMLNYEQLFSLLSRRMPSVTICQYDVREFDGPAVLEAIKAHPDVFEVGLGRLVG